MGVVTYWSLFSGIAGFDAGLEESGMSCTLQVEKDRDCNRILEKHFRHVRRIDDVARLRSMLEPKNAKRFSAEFVRPYAICGGFPCQDVSVAGKRAGLAGARSGLWFTFRRIIALVKPELVLIENVPGLLSSNGGRDMGTILGGLARIGYGLAYRVLDAQYFGVPQRRRRVFVVGCLGDWKRAAQILFESHGLQGHPAPSREAGAGIAASLSAGSANDSGVNRPRRRREDDVNLVPLGIGGGDLSHAVNGDGSRFGSGRGCQDTFVGVVGPLNAHSVEHGHSMTSQQAAESGHIVTAVVPLLEVGKRTNGDGDRDGDGIGEPGDPMFTLQRGAQHGISVFSIAQNQRGEVRTSDIAPQLTCGGGKPGEGYSAIAYRVHGEHSTAMTGNGDAAVAAPVDVARSLDSCGGYATNQGGNVVAFEPTYLRNGRGGPDEITRALRASEDGGRTDCKPHVASRMGVRRLTPLECERLQGFPDDWTRWDAQGNELSDSARYRMCGNAVCRTVSRWIGRRIIESITPPHPQPETEGRE